MNSSTTAPVAPALDSDAALLAGIDRALAAGTMTVFTAETGLAACATCHGMGTRANTWTGARETCTPCDGTGLCQHGDAVAARLPGDAVASAWECEECGHLTAWDAETFAFCNATPWSPPAPADVSPLAWTLKSRGARLAHYAPTAR